MFITILLTVKVGIFFFLRYGIVTSSAIYDRLDDRWTPVHQIWQVSTKGTTPEEDD
jgi:hypothetical protein